MRRKRAIGAIWPVLGKFAAKYAKDNEERLARRTIDCNLNNSGCMQNMCWTNCGPRLYSADWCYVTKNHTVPKKEIKIVSCEKDSDCNPCWKCAFTCTMEGINADPHK